MDQISALDAELRICIDKARMFSALGDSPHYTTEHAQRLHARAAWWRGRAHGLETAVAILKGESAQVWAECNQQLAKDQEAIGEQQEPCQLGTTADA